MVVIDIQMAEEYRNLFEIYRAVIEGGGTQLPKPKHERDHVIRLFREELGIG
jgi:hypothetical protein